MTYDQNSPNISYSQYRSNKFVIGASQMSILQELMQRWEIGLHLKIKTAAGTLAETEQIQEICSHLVSESVVELTESGTIIFEKY